MAAPGRGTVFAMNGIILTCTDLVEFVDAAQRTQGTGYPVVAIDRLLHINPPKMQQELLRALEQAPQADTVLVAMGFCGGVWDGVCLDRRVVIPRVDDCVSMLLTTGDDYNPSCKEQGHMYVFVPEPLKYAANKMIDDYLAAEPRFARQDRNALFHQWFDHYYHLDVIDHGVLDVYSEEYVTAAQECADQMEAELGFVPGSNLLLEKLVSGRWDRQFLVAQPGQTIRHSDFFE